MRVGNLQLLREAGGLGSLHGIGEWCYPAMPAWLGSLGLPIFPLLRICDPFILGLDDKFVDARALLRMFCMCMVLLDVTAPEDMYDVG